MATIKDIANKLGISISTVSKGLNGASDISEDTRQQVLDTAVSLGYVLKKKKKVLTQKLCIMVQDTEYEHINQFTHEIINGFQLAATEKNYEVAIMPISKQMQAHQTFEHLMNQYNYKGALIIRLSSDDIYSNQLIYTQIPTVLLNKRIENHYVGYVGTDNEEGIFYAIKNLYKLGHSKIALLNDEQNSIISRQMYNGFIQSMAHFGLPLDNNLIKHSSCTPDQAKNYIGDFLQLGVTAIVCASDIIASGVINEIHRLGKRVPEDISVIGYNDLPIAKYLAPPLCTIRQDHIAIGKSALNMLDSIINGIYVRTTLLRPQYIHRESIAPKTRLSFELHNK